MKLPTNVSPKSSTPNQSINSKRVRIKTKHCRRKKSKKKTETEKPSREIQLDYSLTTTTESTTLSTCDPESGQLRSLSKCRRNRWEIALSLFQLHIAICLLIVSLVEMGNIKTWFFLMVVNVHLTDALLQFCYKLTRMGMILITLIECVLAMIPERYWEWTLFILTVLLIIFCIFIKKFKRSQYFNYIIKPSQVTAEDK